MKTKLLSILEDHQWKYPRDLLEAGTSYSQMISRLRRKQGYVIEDDWVDKVGGSKKYRLVAKPRQIKNREASGTGDNVFIQVSPKTADYSLRDGFIPDPSLEQPSFNF